MVSFSCEVCNDVIKKPKLDSHRGQCRGAYFTCIDCNTTFSGNDHKTHTSCISEAQKYQGALYKPEKGKGKKSAKATQQQVIVPVVIEKKVEEVAQVEEPVVQVEEKKVEPVVEEKAKKGKKEKKEKKAKKEKEEKEEKEVVEPVVESAAEPIVAAEEVKGEATPKKEKKEKKEKKSKKDKKSEEPAPSADPEVVEAAPVATEAEPVAEEDKGDKKSKKNKKPKKDNKEKGAEEPATEEHNAEVVTPEEPASATEEPKEAATEEAEAEAEAEKPKLTRLQKKELKQKRKLEAEEGADEKEGARKSKKPKEEIAKEVAERRVLGQAFIDLIQPGSYPLQVKKAVGQLEKTHGADVVQRDLWSALCLKKEKDGKVSLRLI